jgi:hypothetical protein
MFAAEAEYLIRASLGVSLFRSNPDTPKDAPNPGDRIGCR